MEEGTVAQILVNIESGWVFLMHRNVRRSHQKLAFVLVLYALRSSVKYQR